MTSKWQKLFLTTFMFKKNLNEINNIFRRKLEVVLVVPILKDNFEILF
jgi:hypothetical protein